MLNTRRTLPTLLVGAALLGCSGKSIYQPTPQPETAPKRSTTPTLSVPRGHLPAPGECRVWVPGKAPGSQARPRACAGIERSAPAGSWIVYRPMDTDGRDGKGKANGNAKGHDKKVVHVRLVDERRAGVVVRVRVFDAVSGVLVSEEKA